METDNFLGKFVSIDDPGTNYDADYDIVKWTIKHVSEPNNLTYEDILKQYYLIRLNMYWVDFIEYIESDDIHDIKPMYPGSISQFEYERYLKLDQLELENRIATIRENLTNYKDQFSEKYMKIQTDERLNMKDILNTFGFISQLACLVVTPKQMSYLGKLYRVIDNLHLLVNETGLFGFNTYLHALFENVHLIGVPTKPTSYDLTYTCPSLFLEHDIQHISEFAEHLDIEYSAKEMNRYIYYLILHDNTLSNRIKRLYILTIWSHVHELVNFIDGQKDSVIKACQGFEIKFFDHLFIEYYDILIPLIEEYPDLRLCRGQRKIVFNKNDADKWNGAKLFIVATFYLMTYIKKNQSSIDAYRAERIAERSQKEAERAQKAAERRASRMRLSKQS